MPNPLSTTDNTADKPVDKPQTSQMDLSANIWEDMKQTFQKQLTDKSAVSALDFGGNDIYGFCPAPSPKDEEIAAKAAWETQWEKSPQYGKSLTTMKELNEFANKNFDKIDTNHDGFMSTDELKKEQASLNESDVDERAAVEILIKHQDILAQQSNDEFGFENTGITKADLKEFGKQIEQDRATREISHLGYGEGDFEKFDSDHDGYLSREEVDKGIAHTCSWAGPDQDNNSSLHQLRQRFDEVQTSDKGVSKQDLRDYRRYADSDKPADEIEKDIRDNREKHHPYAFYDIR